MRKISATRMVFWTLLLAVGIQALPASAGQAVQSPPSVAGNVRGVCVGPGGRRYVVGDFNGNTDFDPGPVTVQLNSVSTDAFVTCFNPDGTHAWSRSFSSAGTDQAFAVTASATHVYVTGIFNGTAVLDGSTSGVASAAQDVFILKLNAITGAADTAFSTDGIQTFGGGGTDSSASIALSADGLTVYTAGTFGSTNAGVGGLGSISVFSGANTDAYVLALNSATGAADLVFSGDGVQTFGGGAGDSAFSVTVHDSTPDIVFVSGFYNTSAAVGGGTTIPAIGGQDGFVMALNGAEAGAGVAGTAVTAFSVDGVQTFAGTGTDVINAAATQASTLYLTGNFANSNFGIGGFGAGFATGQQDGMVIALDVATGAAVTSFSGDGIQTFGGVATDSGQALVATASGVYVCGFLNSFNIGIGGVGTLSTINLSQDACVIALDPVTGAPLTAFSGDGIETLGTSNGETGFGLALSGTQLLAAGTVPTNSVDFGVGGSGTVNTLSFGGFLQPLNLTTGKSIPVITSSINVAAGVNTSFYYQITASGGPITSYGALALPPGLSLDTGTGIISGIPTAAINTAFTIEATNSEGTGSALVTITILADAVAVFHPPVAQGNVRSIAMDGAGNRYLAGDFNSVRDFNPGVGVDARASVGGNDAFVTRFNADGSYAWTQVFGGTVNDQAFGVTVSGTTVYATGVISSFNAGFNGAGSIAQSAGNDVFVLALDADTGAPQTLFDGDGVLLFGGFSNDQGNAVLATPTTVYVTGFFNGNNVGFNGPGPLVSSGGSDAMVLALDARTGAPLTSFSGDGIQTLTGVNSENGFALLLNGGTLYMGGVLQSNNAGIGALGSISSVAASSDGVILALDAVTGAPVLSFSGDAVQTFGGTNTDFISGLALSGGTLYACGTFTSLNAGIGGIGGLQAPGSQNEAMVLAVNAATGAPETGFSGDGVQTFGGTASDQAFGIAISGGGNVVVTGLFNSALAGIGGPGTIATAGGSDLFILELLPNGTPTAFSGDGVERFGGTGGEQGNAIVVSGTTAYVGGFMGSTNASLGGSPALYTSSNLFQGLAAVFDLSAAGAPPVITGQLTVGASFGQNFSYQITATNGPTYFDAGPLPLGLSIDKSTGIISGRIGATGGVTVTLLAANASGAGLANLGITIVGDVVAATYPPVVQGNVRALAVDAAGNRYLVGEFGVSRDFNPGVGTDGKHGTGGNDAFVTRYNADGTYAWTTSFGSLVNNDGATGVTVDNDLDAALGGPRIYVTGFFNGNAGFNGRPIPGLTSINNDAFVIALDLATGQPVTAFGGDGVQVFTGGLTEQGNAIAVNPATHDVFVAGTFNSANAGLGTTASVATVGIDDAFFLALDSNGAAITAFSADGIQTFGGTSNDRGLGIAVSPDGSTIYATGFFINSANINGEAAIPAVGANNQDVFVLALDFADGTSNTGFSTDGVQTFGGTGTFIGEQGTAIIATASKVYVTGMFRGNANIGGVGSIPSNASSDDAFVLALNTNGSPDNTFSANAVQNFGTNNFTESGQALTIDGTTLYFTGFFTGNGAGLGGTGPINSQGGNDLFTVALILDGVTDGAAETSFNTDGIVTFGGNNGDQGNGIAVTGGTVVSAGILSSTANVNFGGVTPATGITASNFGGLLLELPAATGALPALPFVTTPTAMAVGLFEPFSYTISATNMPTSYNAFPLPAGLVINPATGEISGMPQATGAPFTINLTATNAAGTGVGILTLNVIANVVANATPPIIQGNVRAMAIDSSGNRYYTGDFNVVRDFNPGAGYDVKQNFGIDAFVTRYNADNSYAWTQTFSGTNTEQGNAITVTATGEVYVAGYFNSTNAGVGGLGVESTFAIEDAFILALDAATGAPIPTFGVAGVQTFGGTNNDRAQGITTDGTNIWVTGHYSVNAAIGGGNVALPGAGFQDVFILALQPDGTALTSFSGDGIQTFGCNAAASIDQATAIAISGTTVYVTGQFRGPAGFGGAGTISPTVTTDEAFVLAVDTTGAPTAFGTDGVVTFGGATVGGLEAATALAVTGTALYAAGYFQAATAAGIDEATTIAAVPANLRQAFVIALNPTTGAALTGFNGNAIKTFGGTLDDQANAVTVDGNGNVYVAGQFQNTGLVDGAGSPSVVANTGVDAFMFACASNGTLLSGFSGDGLERFGGTGGDLATAIGTHTIPGPVTTIHIAGAANSTTAGFGTVNNSYTYTNINGFSLPVILGAPAPATPVITWVPAGITYPSVLTAAQFNATASVPGTFVYSPPLGTLLNAGAQPLTATFTPNDLVNFIPVTACVALTVNKGTAAISVAGLLQDFDGTPKSVTPSSVPTTSGTYTVLYNSFATPPSAIGVYTVAVTLTDMNYNGSATVQMGIRGTGASGAVLTLNGLTQTYNGSARIVTATTNPPGLGPVTVTYDGSLTPPINPGTYNVEARLNSYTHAANPDPTLGTLTIDKATATVIVGTQVRPFTGLPQVATYTTDPPGLGGATITYNGSTTPPSAMGTYAVVVTLSDPNYQGTGFGTLVIGDSLYVTLDIAGANMAESGGMATVTATLSEIAGQDVTVNLGFGGSATAGDYTPSASVITVPAGSLTGSITLTGNADGVDELNETLIVDVDSVLNGLEFGTQQVVATIIDDDDPPPVTLSLTGSPLAENGGVATVTATLATVSSQDVTVTLGYSGSASSGEYTAGTSIMIAAGTLSNSLDITGIDDSLDESAETVIVDITAVTNATEASPQQVAATITDDDAAPNVTLTLTGGAMSETGGAATVTASLSSVSGQTVTVNLGFTGTANNPADYTRSGMSILIPAGSLSSAVTLTSVSDVLDEADETIIVDITGVTNGAESGTQQVVATITDDDASPLVTLGLSGSPFAEAGGIATVTATLSAVSGRDVTVNLGFGGSASGADYTPSTGSITILAGNTAGNMTLTGSPDLLNEASEVVIVDVTGVTNGTESGTQQVIASITDDDALPNVTLNPLVGSPLAENGGAATLTATLSAVSGQDVTVNLGFSGTASGSDYTAASSILIAAGSLSNSISITGVDDLLDEPSETVIADITTVVNGNEAVPQTRTATITDDDAPPDVTLSLTGGAMAETGGIATVTATLSAVSSQNVTVTLGFTGTATNIADYTRSSASILIAAGTLSNTITLTGVGDTVDESDETIIVDITGVTNGTESGTQQVTATVIDDDAAPTVTLAVAGSPFAENGGVATVTAILSSASGQDVTVNLGFGGTALNGTDYTPSAGFITVLAGNATGNMTLTGLVDALNEAAETVTVDITTVIGGTESGTQQIIASITDDDAAPTVTLGLSGSPLVENGGVGTVTATLSAVSGQDVTVNLGYTGTASGADYSAASSIVIIAGSLANSIGITGVDDLLDETNETVIVDITGVTNGTESGSQQVTATITDDDATPDVTLSLTGSAMAEAGGLATVTATLSAVSSQNVTVNLDFTGTAINPADYTRSGSSILIVAGALSNSITLTGVSDTVDEADETIVVDINGVTNGNENGTQQVTATIVDDDAAPTVSLSMANSPLAEAGGIATLTATLSTLSDQTVTVNLGYSGTASAGDYTAATSIVITPGNLFSSIPLTGTDDAVNEAAETIVADITSVTNGTESGTQQSTATITDDDPVPTVTLNVAPPTLTEAAGATTITATLSVASEQDVIVNLGYSGTATSGTDYSAASAIVITAGALSNNIVLTAIQDGLDETNETVIVDITSVVNGSETGTQQGTATITDDDAGPSVVLGLSGSPLAENGGVATVTASLSAVSALDVTINLAVTGNAANGTDYTPSAGFILIAAGTLNGSITLTGVDDAANETAETIVVDIASVTNGVENGTQQVSAFITNDDAPSAVTLTPATIAEGAPAGTLIGSFSAVGGDPANTFTYTLVTGTGSTDNASFSISGGILSNTAVFDFDTKSTYAIRVRCTDGGGLTVESALTVTVTSVNQPPVLTSQPTATPATAQVGVPIAFAVVATDADNDPLTYTWAFGDGSNGTGSSVTHSYSTAGTYTALLTITDGQGGSAAASVAVVITVGGGAAPPTETDTDGDGFADEIETAAGSNPNLATDTPFGGQPAGESVALASAKLRIKVDFNKSGKDYIVLSGTLAASETFTLGGQVVVVNVGGVAKSFTLDAKGKSKSGSDLLTVSAKKPSSSTVKFTLRRLGGTFAPTLAAIGITSQPATNTPVNVPLTILFDRRQHTKSMPQSYTNKNGKGSTKDRR